MNTLIQEGGQGSGRITDTALHEGLLIGQVEILEDDTDFEIVNMQTKNGDTLAWSVSATIAGTGIEPHFGTGHKKGEYIAGIAGFQRFVAIKLSAGSLRYYNA